MACFLVPTGEAIVAKIVEKKVVDEPCNDGRVSMKTKLGWLNRMLWGGALLLAVEHIWHGEVVLYPPFLTAMASSADMAEMFAEMSTVGVGMALFVTAVWAVMCVVADRVPAIRAAVNEA